MHPPIIRQLRFVNMSFFKKIYNPKGKSLSHFLWLGCYIVFLIFIFPLIIDFLKTFFFLENFQQKGCGNFYFFIVSFIIFYFITFPYVTNLLKNNRIISDIKTRDCFFAKEKLFKLIALILFYISFPFFIFYSCSELSSLKKSNQYYLDCKKIIHELEKSDDFYNLNIYVEHTPYLFWNRGNIHSRVLPLEYRVKDKRELLIITDCINDYFYLNREGLLFSKITPEVAVYSNSASAIDYLKKLGYSFSNYFYFDKYIPLQEIAKQNNIDIGDCQYIELQRKNPVIYNDQYLYSEGNYLLEFEIENNNISSIQRDVAYIEFHLGRTIKKIFLNNSEFVNKKKINKSFSLTLNSMEQGTFISIMSLANLELSLNSIIIKKY